jgi:hypothetical protein
MPKRFITDHCRSEVEHLMSGRTSRPALLPIRVAGLITGRESMKVVQSQGGMMMIAVSMVVAAALAQSVPSNQPSAMLLAQAHDRCMTTYAVRLTKTTAPDDAIYAEAVAGCKAVKDQLATGIAREYPAAQAAELTAMLEAQAKPNFLALVQRIRTDRLGRPGN